MDDGQAEEEISSRYLSLSDDIPSRQGNHHRPSTKENGSSKVKRKPSASSVGDFSDTRRLSEDQLHFSVALLHLEISESLQMIQLRMEEAPYAKLAAVLWSRAVGTMLATRSVKGDKDWLSTWL